jgi:hypothetical protein
MRLAAVVFVVLASLVFPTQAQAPETNSILVGEARLRLGMPKEFVIHALQSSYEFGPVGEGEDLSFKTKGSARDADPEGFLSFRESKLTEVMKLWNGNQPNTVPELMRAIYGAMSSLSKNSLPCSVFTFDDQKPTEEKKGVTVSCGDHHVSVFTNRVDLAGKSAEFGIVNESLRY